jgi:hypothetical protein
MSKKFYKEDNENIPSIVYSETQPPVNSDGNSYSEITDQNQLDDLFFKLNNKRSNWGKDYISSFKVENFGENYRDGNLSDSNIYYLYQKLALLIAVIKDGNIDCALFILNNEINTITQADIDNGYTQEIHDSIVNDLTNYLNQ